MDAVQAEKDQAVAADAKQPSLDCFLQTSVKYLKSHPKQKAITNAILNDLIVDMALPFSIVENPSWRHFMNAVDPKYINMSRRTHTDSLVKLYDLGRNLIREEIGMAEHVSVTVDLWTDRAMRGYLGVTAHYMGETMAP